MVANFKKFSENTSKNIQNLNEQKGTSLSQEPHDEGPHPPQTWPLSQSRCYFGINKK